MSESNIQGVEWGKLSGRGEMAGLPVEKDGPDETVVGHYPGIGALALVESSEAVPKLSDSEVPGTPDDFAEAFVDGMGETAWGANMYDPWGDDEGYDPYAPFIGGGLQPPFSM